MKSLKPSMSSLKKGIKNKVMNLDKDKKYVVACSFGPDSMALLSMMQKDGYNICVAHVNYHKRKESDYEEQSLRKYCAYYNLDLFVLDTTGLKQSGNFQQWARKIRYNFFKDVLAQTKSDAVVVAHQQDDLIETYLMQSSKKSFVSYYGIENEMTLFGVKIVRPLLSYTKSFLEKYDIENNVPYSIDWTNLTNLYSRNKIRHEIVEKMSTEQREKILKEICEKNKTKKTDSNVDLERNIWDLQEFLNESEAILILQISNNLQKRNLFKKLTQKWIKNVKKSFFNSRANIAEKILQNIHLVKSYSKVYLIDFDQFRNYDFEMLKPGIFVSEFVDFEFGENDVDRNISKEDFPLKIRPVKSSEAYQIENYSVEVRRLFIDWKMPKFLRGWWPGIYDKNGHLLYIPRYREKYTDNHPSKLTIKYPRF